MKTGMAERGVRPRETWCQGRVLCMTDSGSIVDAWTRKEECTTFYAQQSQSSAARQWSCSPHSERKVHVELGDVGTQNDQNASHVMQVTTLTAYAFQRHEPSGHWQSGWDCMQQMKMKQGSLNRPAHRESPKRTKKQGAPTQES